MVVSKMLEPKTRLCFVNLAGLFSHEGLRLERFRFFGATTGWTRCLWCLGKQGSSSRSCDCRSPLSTCDYF